MPGHIANVLLLHYVRKSEMEILCSAVQFSLDWFVRPFVYRSLVSFIFLPFASSGAVCNNNFSVQKKNRRKTRSEGNKKFYGDTKRNYERDSFILFDFVLFVFFFLFILGWLRYRDIEVTERTTDTNEMSFEQKKKKIKKKWHSLSRVESSSFHCRFLFTNT